jgi:hypothetical protein
LFTFEQLSQNFFMQKQICMDGATSSTLGASTSPTVGQYQPFFTCFFFLGCTTILPLSPATTNMDPIQAKIELR